MQGLNLCRLLFNYNFNPRDIADLNSQALYEIRRRDSCFAFAFEKDNRIYALRNHFGTVPSHFSLREDEMVFSTTLDQLITPESRLDVKGYKAYVAFGTAKILPLFKGIGIVPPTSVIEIDRRSEEVKVC
jgi:asparagine synthetase B (glutamine-hydrolysing)